MLFLGSVVYLFMFHQWLIYLRVYVLMTRAASSTGRGERERERQTDTHTHTHREAQNEVVMTTMCLFYVLYSFIHFVY